MEIIFPISYTQNNERELEVLKRADNFLRQYCYLYPSKPEPPLIFENECQVKKLTCTTLCPSRITKTISLNEWKHSAKFLADYVEYKPTRFPLQAPYKLFSLDAILKRREGNSLEMSMLLCSFLLSSSYDAFVVQGYATPTVTEKLQKSASNPLDHISEKFKHYVELYRPKKTEKKGKYSFDFYAAKRYWMENRYPKAIKTEIIPKEANAEIISKETKAEKIPGKTKIVIVPGETKTKIIPEETKTETSPNETKTDIIPEGAKTEPFPKQTKAEMILEETKTEIIPGETGELIYEKRIHFWVLLRSLENKKVFIEASTGELFLIDDPNYLGVEFLWNNKNFWYYKSDCVGSCKHINFELLEGKEWGQFLPTLIIQSEADDSRIRMPDTWIRDLEITQEQYENRFHPDGKYVRYEMAVATQYNRDCLKSGLVHKITYYKESICSVPVKILTFFEGREDKLQHRSVDCTLMIAQDMFSIGREDAVKEHKYSLKENPEFIETITFYSDLREDDLHTKEWNNKWVKDTFVDRMDRLNYREIIYHDENIFDDKKNLNIEKQSKHLPDDNKRKETPKLKYHIVPSMFQSFEILFEDIEFSQLDMQTFLQVIDPAERYASTDSDSEKESEVSEQESSLTTENGGESPTTEGDAILKKSLESVEKKINETNKESLDDFVKQNIKDGNNAGTHQSSVKDTDDEENIFENEEMYSDFDKHTSKEKIFKDNTGKESKAKELEAFDDINFDNLSDEELQTDYKLFLFSLWEEFSNEDNMDLFFMREFGSNNLEKNTLEAKRKIIRKRRKNMRYQQRLEHGKPTVRVHKKKLDEDSDKMSFYATDIANHFRLDEKFPGCNFADVKEFEPSMDILNEFSHHVEAEMVEKECLEIYNTSLKQARDVDKVKKKKRIICYKKSFFKDPAVPKDHSIKEVWYLPETSSFRIDFHYPEEKSGGRKLLFTKPTCKSTAFKFRDYLFRQITPSYETAKVSKARLYSYLVSLLKEEPVVLKELELFEEDMKTLLARREIEIRDISEAL